MVEVEPIPALEISELMSLMDDLPGIPGLKEPSLLESPSSPHSTTTEDISIFGNADFDGLHMDFADSEENGQSALEAALMNTTTYTKTTRRNPRKRSSDEAANKMNPTAEDAARKAQRMARNRRAAATSRARKKEHLESLQAQVERLQTENAELRRRLIDAGLMSDDQEEQLGQRPYGLQPAALCWTDSPQLEYPLPMPQLHLLLSLALLRLHLQTLAWLRSMTVSIYHHLTPLPREVKPGLAACMPSRCGMETSFSFEVRHRKQMCAMLC